MIGKTISHYEILEKLGEGGMGVVYKARDTRLERDVALKFIRPEFIRTETEGKRFLREARALATLDHPNICAVHELDEAEGRTFIAMAFVEGNGLREIATQDPMAISRALDIIRQVAKGVQAAHEKNVIHRDIKSTNIIITPQGDAKILDFGLARISDRTTLTTEGMTMGTVAYMSPEQATGDTVDHRTDIWALGVLLHELITGSFPFYADFDQAIVYLILNEDPKPISHYRDDAPPGLQNIIDRTLAKNVEERFQSAAKLIDAIDNVVAGEAAGELSKPAGTTNTAATKHTSSTSASPPPAVEIDPNMVAVLDFANTSGNTDDDWLSGGIAETLTADLKRVASLRLVARSAIVPRLAGQPLAEIEVEQVASIGSALGAQWVVWGNYQKLGDTLRITAKFSNTSSGDLVDSCMVDGSMQEVFKLQDRIVTGFVDATNRKLASGEREKIEQDETGDEKAYEFYARARHRANQMGAKDFEETKRLYQKALELDPGYALAYSGLGGLYMWRHIANACTSDLDNGTVYLQKAIECDPELAEPYVWMTYAHMRKENLEEARAAGRKAVALDEHHPIAHYFLACVVGMLGTGLMERWGGGPYADNMVHESVMLMKRSIELDPKSQPAHMWLGWMYMLHGQYEPAMNPLEKAVEIEDAHRVTGVVFVGGRTLYGNLLFRLRRLDVARLAYQSALASLEQSQHVYRDSFTAQTYCGLGDIDYTMGNFDEALKHYGKAVEISDAKPERSGIGYVYVRGCAGMSKSFYNMGVTREARDKLQLAIDSLRNKKRLSFFWIWDGCDAQAYYDLASAHAVLQEKDDAIESISNAVRLGWRNLPELEVEENLASLIKDKRLGEIIEEVRRTPPLP